MTDNHSPGREQVREVLDWAVTEGGAPSVAVHIRDEQGAWFGAAGLADPETGAKRVPGEIVPAGSISKAFTAAAVLNLAAEGRLGLEDTVDQWLPGVMDGSPYDGAKITIRQLLSNTSGLFSTGMALELQRRINIRAEFAKHRFDVWQPEDTLRVALSEPPVHQPGEAFCYSNGGFSFAAAIIERATGNSFESEVDRAVIRQLGLRHTFMRGREDTGYRGRHPRLFSKIFLREGVQPEQVTPDNWPSMMEDPNLPPLDTTELNSSWAWGATNIFGTLEELTTSVNALLTGTLLPAAQHRDMWTTVSTEGAPWLAGTRYGLGVFELTLADGQLVRGATGATMGSYTLVMGTPDGRRTLAAHVANDYTAFPVLDRLLAAEFGATGLRLAI